MKKKKNKVTEESLEREDRMEMEGLVEEAMAGTLFNVSCGPQKVIATLSGRMRQNQIRILPGDRVLIEVSPYDTTRGRIMRRL